MPQQRPNREALLPILTPARASARDFVEQWSQWYDYPGEELYASNIGRPLAPARIRELFEWKNGGKLSAKKLGSIERHYVPRCAELRNLDPSTSAAAFLREFGGGPIWRIFLLHCWQPTRFPIYDQHVHRAMEFIQTGSPREIPSSVPAVLRAYVDRYLPFWQSFMKTPTRTVDKALWVFGRVLKQLPASIWHDGHSSVAGHRFSRRLASNER